MPEKRYLGDVEVGEAVGPVSYVMTRERAQFAASNLGITEFETDASGNLLAPGCATDNDYLMIMAEGFTAKEPVHTKADNFYINPPTIGKRMTVSGEVTDKYTKRGRDFVVFETITRDQDGREIVRSRNTLLIEL